MNAATEKSFEGDFYTWFRIFLKDKGLQFTQCGFKLRDSLGSGHGIDLGAGNWERPGYSSNKPPRWLYHLEFEAGGALVAKPVVEGASNIGQANTAQADKAGLVVRLLPLIRTGEGAFQREDGFEAHVLFVFHGATPQGSSSETFSFDPATGAMRYKDELLDYIAVALIGRRARDAEVEVTVEEAGGPVSRTLRYGDMIDALAASIQVAPKGAVAGAMPVFDLTDKAELERLKKAVADAWAAAGPVPVPAVAGAAAEDDAGDEDDEEAAPIVIPDPLEVPENTELLGIEPGVYRQINAALRSGKQHIMLYGPPGTGKTTLARWIASSLTGGGTQWTLITGSADWSSQDIIGGYQPIGGGGVAFVPGVLLRRFDRPLIIDELNRCDIDKVIGPLFTVLSGQQTTLPYRLDIEDANSRQYVILPESKPTARAHEFAPGPAWRLIATINSIDKASLYQMSYALSRRFGWVYVDAPRDTAGFIASFLRREDPVWGGPVAGAPCPLGAFWTAINKVRVIGPAPIIDAIRAVRGMAPGADFFAAPDAAMREALLDAIDMVLLPMLDGIVVTDAEFLAGAAAESFGFDAAERVRIKARMDAVAV